MLVNRRNFVTGVAGSIATGLLAKSLAGETMAETKIKAVAFDAFTVFDPRPGFRIVRKTIRTRRSDSRKYLAHPPVRIHLAAQFVASLCGLLEGHRRCPGVRS